MKVPFIDLKAQCEQIEQDVLIKVKEIMKSAMFIGGPDLDGFESEFAEFCDAKFCLGVNSGTDALRFALLAAGVQNGDEVITVPNTFIATTEAISQVGATPVFVDINPETCNINVNCIEEMISTRTRVILPVHLYGQPADMDPILEIARKYNLIVIEDACQAHGATYKEKKVGSIGVAGCFSFYPGKNLGAFGEGGAVVTDDEEITGKIRMIRDHGQQKKYFHEIEGYNGRMDAIQASVLRIKLKRLEEWNRSRRSNAAIYNQQLSGAEGLNLVKEEDYARAAYHLYVIMVDDRDNLQRFLADKGIATGLHYPLPLHVQKAYAHLKYKEDDFPVAERCAKRLLSLPMYPELTPEQIQYVAESIKIFLNKYITKR